MVGSCVTKRLEASRYLVLFDRITLSTTATASGVRRRGHRLCLRTVCLFELGRGHGLATVAAVLGFHRMEEMLVDGNRRGIGRAGVSHASGSVLARSPDEQSNQTKEDYHDDSSDDADLQAGGRKVLVATSQDGRAGTPIEGSTGIVVTIIVVSHRRHRGDSERVN